MRIIALAFVLAVFAPACGGDDGEGGEGDTPDASAEIDAMGSQALPFMSECEGNTDCESGLCFPFNSKGPHCTKACTRDAECEDPSPGCNNQGVCKAPDLPGGGGGGGGGGTGGGS